MGARLASSTLGLPLVLAQGEGPVEGLSPPRKGFACMKCDYCSGTPQTHATHWSTKHPHSASSASGDCKDAEIQTHFRSTPRYFAVNTVLRGTNPHSILHLYVKQHTEDVAALNSNTVMPPISPMEVPPLLQETQWHSHLRSFTTSKAKIRALCRLTRLPTGKKAQDDPLGDTLRQVIVLYMRNIHKKGHDSPLDVRGILVLGPT